jgi:hypothetical protein
MVVQDRFDALWIGRNNEKQRLDNDRTTKNLKLLNAAIDREEKLCVRGATACSVTQKPRQTNKLTVDKQQQPQHSS